MIGTMFNVLNLLVLLQKEMRSQPINMLLTGIAVADLVVMVEYIPFTLHMYLMEQTGTRTPQEKYSLGWGMFMYFHSNFTIMIHTVSTWLTLSLAIWRFIMIKFPAQATTLCTHSRCKMLLIFGFGK